MNPSPGSEVAAVLTRNAVVPSMRLLAGLTSLGLPGLFFGFAGLDLILDWPPDHPVKVTLFVVVIGVGLLGAILLRLSTDLTQPLREWERPSLRWVSGIGSFYLLPLGTALVGTFALAASHDVVVLLFLLVALLAVWAPRLYTDELILRPEGLEIRRRSPYSLVLVMTAACCGASA